jgi:hypothetical protein
MSAALKINCLKYQSEKCNESNSVVNYLEYKKKVQHNIITYLLIRKP